MSTEALACPKCGRALTPSAPVQRAAPAGPISVVVTNVDVSFGQMVMLLIKLAFASIPAAIIIAIIGAIFGLVLSALGMAIRG